MRSNEPVGPHGQTWGTKGYRKERTHVSQGLNAGSPLSLGKWAEPEWNGDSAVQGALAKAFRTTQLAANRARSQQGTGYSWGPAQSGRSFQNDRPGHKWRPDVDSGRQGQGKELVFTLQATGREQRIFEPPCWFAGMDAAAAAPSRRPAGGSHQKQEPAQLLWGTWR